MGRMVNCARYFGVSVLVWLADWLIKLILKFSMPDGAVLFGLLKIGDFHNPRGFFGALNLPIVILISFVIIGLLGFLFWKSVSRSEKISLALIFGGGVLNLAERLRYGYVTDYFAVGNLGFFNFADLAIATGVVLLAGKYISHLRIIDQG